MAKFNREKVLRQLEFKRKWRSYSRYVYIAVPCVLCCLLCLYFAYSKFFVSDAQAVIRTTVGDFIYGDVVISAYIDGEYSSTIPGKNDGYVVDKVSCDNGAVGEWNDDDWGLLTTNLIKRTKCNVYFETKKTPLTEVITTAMNSNPGMFATDDPGKNIRYIGKDPDNYVYFNCSDYNNPTSDTCELWRIIGVFNNVVKEDGSKENLVKIIRNDSLGKYSWDNKNKGVGTSIENSGSNDWSDSQLMMMLNPLNYLKSGYTNSSDIISSGSQQLYSKMGSYYNGTKGCKPATVTSGASFSCTEVDFTATGLKNDTTRNAIASVVWNLGGSLKSDDVTPSMFYERERGTTVYSGHATAWTGKIGLMYPSDYGYATNGGTTKNRAACLAKELWNWSYSEFNDCTRNDYLYNSSLSQWTLVPYSAYSDIVFQVQAVGTVDRYYVSATYEVQPVLFLKSNIFLNTGTGAKSDPYTLKIR